MTELKSMSDSAPFPKVMALSDIVRRWIYTKQGVLKLMQQDEKFPSEVATVSGGKVRLWLEADIAAYEQDRPWLKSQSAKERRQTAAFFKSIYVHEAGGEAA